MRKIDLSMYSHRYTNILIDLDILSDDRINFDKEYQLITIDSDVSDNVERKLVENIKNCMIKEINFEINYLDNMLIKDKSDLESELEMLQSHNIKAQV